MKSKPLQHSLAPQVGLGFYVTAFQDYLGARLLLNHALLLQGATLASTAVEKYLKALFAAKGVKAFGHLSDWSQQSLSKVSSELRLNEDFLKLLQMVYEVRYLDNLEKAVSFSIERSKFLAELDHTAAVLNRAVQFKRGDELVNPYDAAKQSARPELIKDNWIIAGFDRKTFLARPDLAEAFYIAPSQEILSCVVTGWVPKDLKNFSASGIIRRGGTFDCTLVGPAA